MRKKHIPMRTCVGCRTSKAKRELIRIVRTPDSDVILDLTGKRSGRGVYICADPECLAKAVRGKQLERSLEIEINQTIIADLQRILNEQNL